MWSRLEITVRRVPPGWARAIRPVSAAALNHVRPARDTRAARRGGA